MYIYIQTYVPSQPTKVLLKQLEEISSTAASPDNGSHDSNTDYAQASVGTPTYEQFGVHYFLISLYIYIAGAQMGL